MKKYDQYNLKVVAVLYLYPKATIFRLDEDTELFDLFTEVLS